MTWADSSQWEGHGVRREVFFFDSAADRLYGSLYAAVDPHLDVRIVICTGWGHELLQLNDLAHAVALGVARQGGAALLFHPPGHGDSTGSIEDLTIGRNLEATVDALSEGTRRVGSGGWGFAGIRTGASVAALAADPADPRQVALIDPALDPAAHFESLERKARRLALGRTGELTLFGHPLPAPAGRELPDPTPLEALARFPGPAAVIRFASPTPDAVPSRGDQVVLPGKFSTPPGPKEQARLAEAAVEWITTSVAAKVAS
jgi:hypothetical protein